MQKWLHKKRINLQYLGFLIFVFVLLFSCSPPEKSFSIDLNKNFLVSTSASDKTIPFESAFYPFEANIENFPFIKLLDSDNQLVWLKFDFTIPSTLQNKELSLFLGRASFSDKTYLNGALLGGSGNLNPYFNPGEKTRLFRLPSTLIKKDKINQLIICINPNKSGLFSLSPFIAETQYCLELASWYDFYSIQLREYLISSLILILVLVIIIWISKEDSDASFFATLYLANSIIYLTLFSILNIPSLHRIPIPYLGFIHLIIMLQLFSLVAYLVLFIMSLKTFVFNKSKFLFLLSPSQIIAFSAALFDFVFHTVLQSPSSFYASNFGFLFLVIVLIIIFAERYVMITKDAKNIQTHLEELVTERTRKLDDTNLNLHKTCEELRRNQSDLVRAAREDALTGLANRTAFNERIEEESQRFERLNNYKPYSLAFFDLDNFKQVNDNYGHAVGDAVLRRFALILKESMRAIDIIARYGGDEFVVLMPQTTKEEALGACDRVLAKIKQEDGMMKTIREYASSEIIDDIVVGCSIGIAEAKLGEKAQAILNRADEALYYIKRTGKDGVLIADI